MVLSFADGVVKYKPRKQEDYWEEEGEFEGVEEEHIEAITTELLRI